MNRYLNGNLLALGATCLFATLISTGSPISFTFCFECLVFPGHILAARFCTNMRYLRIIFAVGARTTILNHNKFFFRLQTTKEPYICCLCLDYDFLCFRQGRFNKRAHLSHNRDKIKQKERSKRFTELFNTRCTFGVKKKCSIHEGGRVS